MQLISAFDGDTIRANVNQGFDDWRGSQPFRLYGIDTPEMRNETLVAARRSRDWLLSQVPVGSYFYGQTLVDRRLREDARSERHDQYRRYMLVMYRTCDDMLRQRRSLNVEMLELGLAVPMMHDPELFDLYKYERGQ